MRAGYLGEHFVIDLFATFGVALNDALGLARLSSGVGGEAVGSFANLAKLVVPATCGAVLRLRMQRFVGFLPAPREQRLRVKKPNPLRCVPG